MKRKTLLTVDGIINLGLGGLLIVFPDGLVEFLGIPAADSRFYPSILGAVLVGIGIALLFECRNPATITAGLGLKGAIAINLCGALVLGAWLLFGDLGLPVRGQVFLWIVVVVLVGISTFEIMGGMIKPKAGER